MPKESGCLFAVNFLWNRGFLILRPTYVLEPKMMMRMMAMMRIGCTTHLFVFGLFFLSLSWTWFSFTCFHIPVLLTSSDIFIAESGMFITFPLARGIFKFPSPFFSISSGCSGFWGKIKKPHQQLYFDFDGTMAKQNKAGRLVRICRLFTSVLSSCSS